MGAMFRFMTVILVLLMGLNACTTKYSTNGENLYKKSRNGAQLEVPAPLTASNLSNFYTLPAQNNPNPEVNIAPPSFV